MDLDLSDEQRALVDSVGSVLGGAWPPSALRALVEGDDGVGGDDGVAALWERLVSLDWPALTVDEAFGGMGYGAVEAMLVHEGGGRAVIGGPLFPTTALFAPAVSALGTDEQQHRWLAGVTAGEITGTAGLVELRQDGARPTVVAVERGDGWRLSGTMHSVIEGGRTDRIVVPAIIDDITTAFVVPVAAVDAQPIRSVDASRRLATVSLGGVSVGPEAALGVVGDPATADHLDAAVDHAVTALAAELVGTSSTILDMTLDHVKTREQFGVRIGSFQALKHRLADCYLGLEAARASVRVASVALDEADPRRAVAASTAMALAADSARRIATDGIQLLGGIGFTWEHDVHMYVKRVLGSSVLLGTAEAHRQRVADLIGLVPA